MVQLLKRSSFFIGIGIAIILFFIFTQNRDEDQPELTAISSHVPDDNHTDSPNSEEKVMVDIKGEVNKPGVYELDANARVEDAIQMADGFTKNADQTTVNLAQKVVDEMMVIVPKEGDVKAQEGSDVNGEKIRINDASQEEIESITGIGPSKAEAIIQYREEHGMFQTAEDLLEISGIGEKTLENIRDEIQVP
ncbi:MAG TPA: helix-hairpin-helix domain-containing protein [Bacillota bacterium]|nr:helix-hairpin-helix domain-containing protein [Bacillota bacterium]